MSNTVRVYNMSFEETGEGVPLRIDYAGTSYIFQPSDASYDFGTSQNKWVDRGAQVAMLQTVSSFTKREENDLPNYLDVGTGTARYIFERGYGRDKGILKSGDEMQDIVEQQLKQKQAALESVEEELKIAEKKAEAQKTKKRGPGRPSKTEAQA